jgi:hypothetical protein
LQPLGVILTSKGKGDATTTSSTTTTTTTILGDGRSILDAGGSEGGGRSGGGGGSRDEGTSGVVIRNSDYESMNKNQTIQVLGDVVRAGLGELPFFLLLTWPSIYVWP